MPCSRNATAPAQPAALAAVEERQAVLEQELEELLDTIAQAGLSHPNAQPGWVS